MNESLLRIYTRVDDDPTFPEIRHWLQAHGGRMLPSLWTKTKGEISAAVEFPNNSAATHFRLACADRYPCVVGGLNGLLAKAGCKTLLAFTADIEPGSGDARKLCTALDRRYGCVAFHRHDNAQSGDRAPFVIPAKRWLHAAGRWRTLPVAWNLCFALFDAERVADFYRERDPEIVALCFIPEKFVFDMADFFARRRDGERGVFTSALDIVATNYGAAG